jgi:hypothetical protein
VGQPVVPVITLVDPPATVAPASTSFALTVRMAAAYTAPVKGLLTLNITPETGGNDPVVNSADPLLAFANGQRTVGFTIASGATSVVVPVASTGTVASTVGVSLTGLEASGAPIAQTPSAKFFRIVPAAPSITSACYVRTNAEDGIYLNFQVTGFSNTRELTKALVTTPGLAAGKPNIPVPDEFLFDSTDTMTVEASGVATGYYSTALNVRTGGAFTLTIPVTLKTLAPTAKLDSVQLSLANSVGSTAPRAVLVCQ